MAKRVADELPQQPRILIIRPSALGDVARTVPVLASLKKRWPMAEIDWLVNTHFTDAIKHHPGLHRAVPFDRAGLRGWPMQKKARVKLNELKATLRAAEYDAVIDLQGLARSGLLCRVSGARRRIGDAAAREMAWLHYNRRLTPFDEAGRPPTHTVDQMLGLVRAMGVEPVDDMQLHVGEPDRAWWRAQRERCAAADEPYVVLAPTAKWRCKQWPVERYTELARRLLNEPVVVVLLAAPDEREQLSPIAAELEQTEGDAAERLLIPTTSVGQSMAVLNEAALVVANDSAPLHLAVGLGRPTVALFGPTDPRKVGPYRADDAVLQPQGITAEQMASYRRNPDDQTVISGIATDAVWQKIISTVQGKALADAGG